MTFGNASRCGDYCSVLTDPPYTEELGATFIGPYPLVLVVHTRPGTVWFLRMSHLYKY